MKRIIRDRIERCACQMSFANSLKSSTIGDFQLFGFVCPFLVLSCLFLCHYLLSGVVARLFLIEFWLWCVTVYSIAGKFRKEFRRTFRCRCRWLTDHLPGVGRSRRSVSICTGGPDMTGTRLTQSMAVVVVPMGVTAFEAALASAAPTSAAVATGERLLTKTPPPAAAACYPLRQCRSNHPTARSVRTLTSTTQFISNAPA